MKLELLILLCLHLIGDFYLQTNSLASRKIKRKEENGEIKISYLWVFIHTLIYDIPFFFIFMVIKWYWCLIILLILIVTHFVIDIISCYFKIKCKKLSPIFLVDQIIHFLVLCFCLFLMRSFFSLELPSFIIENEKAIDIIIGCVFLISPASIIISLIMKDIDFNKVIFFKEANEIEEKSVQIISEVEIKDITNKDNIKLDSGMIIGICERLIVFFLALAGAYPAMAIIITVKTWARSYAIKADPLFGNKYLVGTLLSLSFALIIGYLCTLI